MVEPFLWGVGVALVVAGILWLAWIVSKEAAEVHQHHAQMVRKQVADAREAQREARQLAEWRAHDRLM